MSDITEQPAIDFESSGLKTYWANNKFLFEVLGLFNAIGAIFLAIPKPSGEDSQRLLGLIQLGWLIVIIISLIALMILVGRLFYLLEQRIKINTGFDLLGLLVLLSIVPGLYIGYFLIKFLWVEYGEILAYWFTWTRVKLFIFFFLLFLRYVITSNYKKRLQYLLVTLSASVLQAPLAIIHWSDNQLANGVIFSLFAVLLFFAYLISDFLENNLPVTLRKMFKDEHPLPLLVPGVLVISTFILLLYSVPYVFRAIVFVLNF